MTYEGPSNDLAYRLKQTVAATGITLPANCEHEHVSGITVHSVARTAAASDRWRFVSKSLFAESDPLPTCLRKWRHHASKGEVAW